MTTDDLVRINKDYFVKTASMASKTAVFAAFPYLNVPPFNFIISKALAWIINKTADEAELGLFFMYTDLRVDKQGEEYVLAAHAAMLVPTEENLRIADEKFKAFIHFNSL